MSSTSTLIGVAVSVAGNTCISIGLIVQKLSHIRREKEFNSNHSTHTTTRSPRQSQSSNNDERSLLLPLTFTPRRPSVPNNSTLSDSPIILPSTSTFNSNDSQQQQQQQQIGEGVASRILFPILPSTDETGKNKRRIKIKRKKPKIDKSYLKSPLWWLGLMLLNLGELGNFVAYAFAPASLVAPLGTVALVANVVLAPLILKEEQSYRTQDIYGVILSVLGGITVVFSSRAEDKKLFPDELLLAISRIEFIIYSIISVILLVVLAGASRTSLGDKFVMIDVGVCAVAGGATVLSTKAFSSFLNLIFLETFKYPITYPILLVLISSALIQVNFINKSLQRFESRIVIPYQFVSFSLSAIIGSAILYRDFDGMRGEKALNFGFGCLLSSVGVWILTRPSFDTSTSNSDSNEYNHESNSRPNSLNLLSPQTPRNNQIRSSLHHNYGHTRTPSNSNPHSQAIDTPPLSSRSNTIPSLGTRTLSVTLGGGQYLLSSSSKVNSTPTTTSVKTSEASTTSSPNFQTMIRPSSREVGGFNFNFNSGRNNRRRMSLDQENEEEEEMETETETELETETETEDEDDDVERGLVERGK